jgi:hypothetical protein
MVPITINTLWGQDMLISDQDLTLTIDRFGERYIEGAVSAIANMIDGDGCDQYKNIYNFVGTPGVLPADLSTYTGAGVVLSNHAVPRDTMRALVVDPDMEAKALGFGANLFNPAKTIGDQYMSGKMGSAVGFKWNMDQNIARHQLGTLTSSTPLIDLGGQTGSSINTKGWAVSTAILKEGDILTFAGTNGINPASFRDFGKLRTFRVTADVSSDGSGNAAVPIEPPLVVDADSPFQTATASPADGAVIKVYGVAAASFSTITGVSSAQGLTFHREAFTVAIVNLELPGGMDWSERVVHPRLGVSMRLVRGFDIKENRRYTRLDVLGGWKTTRPEMACRVASA